MSFANIILPLPLENKYTYRIPQDLEGSITTGCRVIVSFGAKHFYTGLVAEVVDRAPTPGIEYKEIYALLDSAPVLRRPQLRFWEWIASYYICKLGDVYKAALPSGLKLESETTVTLNPDFEAAAPVCAISCPSSLPSWQKGQYGWGRNCARATSGRRKRSSASPRNGPQTMPCANHSASSIVRPSRSNSSFASSI